MPKFSEFAVKSSKVGKKKPKGLINQAILSKDRHLANAWVHNTKVLDNQKGESSAAAFKGRVSKVKREFNDRGSTSSVNRAVKSLNTKRAPEVKRTISREPNISKTKIEGRYTVSQAQRRVVKQKKVKSKA